VNWINVISAAAPFTDEGVTKLATAYSTAPWLGNVPTGRYWAPRAPFPKAFRQPVSRRVEVDAVFPKMKSKIHCSAETITVMRPVHSRNSNYGFGEVTLPWFDYFELPKGIIFDQALLSIGAKRINIGFGR
jgi:hypothetical protein